MRKTVKVRKIEIDTNSIRIQKENGEIVRESLGSASNIKTDTVYFSMFPALGIGGNFSKGSVIKEFSDYQLVIRSKSSAEYTLVGMVKPVTYANIRVFLSKHRIITRHIFITPFTLHRFARTSEPRHLVVYKGDVLLHIASFENGLTVFAGSYVSSRQLDEFIGEFYEDGNAVLTVLSNTPFNYSPPVDFREIEFKTEEGVLLDAAS